MRTWTGRIAAAAVCAALIGVPLAGLATPSMALEAPEPPSTSAPDSSSKPADSTQPASPTSGPAPSEPATPVPAPSPSPSATPSASATPGAASKPAPTASPSGSPTASPSGSSTATPGTSDAASPGELPPGCATVIPKKPWRLVASRPTPNSSDVQIEWSVVGCTIGYRVAVIGTGVDRVIEVPGGATASLTVPDLSPSRVYRITVTSLGQTGDGGVSGVFRLRNSAITTRAELTVDFTDAVPDGLIAAGSDGRSPWADPLLSWAAPESDEATRYRVTVTGSNGATLVEKVIPGTARSTRLGDEVSAGLPCTVTLTPVLVDGTDGEPSRLVLGKQSAARPAQVTGNAPVIQFSPVADTADDHVLGYEIAYGAGRASTHAFIAAPTDPSTPWVAFDPTFDAVDESDTRLPANSVVATVRTITTLGRSAWTAAQRIPHASIASADAAYFAGIGHLGGDRGTVPRYAFLSVRGGAADLEITDLVWSRSAASMQTPVTVTVYGPGSAAVHQQVPATHQPDAAQDVWRISSLPVPDGWSSIVLRRGGTDVATWNNAGGRPCVAAVTYGDAPTDLPDLWRDSWCSG